MGYNKMIFEVQGKFNPKTAIQRYMKKMGNPTDEYERWTHTYDEIVDNYFGDSERIGITSKVKSRLLGHRFLYPPSEVIFEDAYSVPLSMTHIIRLCDRIKAFKPEGVKLVPKLLKPYREAGDGTKITEEDLVMVKTHLGQGFNVKLDELEEDIIFEPIQQPNSLNSA